jgi:hypothetical protein
VWSIGDAMLEALTGPLKVEKGYFKKMTLDGNSSILLDFCTTTRRYTLIAFDRHDAFVPRLMKISI